MESHFKKIGLFAKARSQAVIPTLQKLIRFLQARGLELFIEENSAEFLAKEFNAIPRIQKSLLGQKSELVIVVGGDGSFLNAARAVVPYHVPMVGINRGRLGFLADILPDKLEQDLDQILKGIYREQKRALLHATVIRDNESRDTGTALNDVVLYAGSIARMIEFEVYIDKHFVLRQRADGFITATPTGSTAYALSGGGPILYPTLEAFVLVPILPHTLTSRPIVIKNKRRIELCITQNNEIYPKLSCDGQQHFDLAPGDRILMEKNVDELILIRPKHQDYFSTLRQKLGWSNTQIKDADHRNSDSSKDLDFN